MIETWVLTCEHGGNRVPAAHRARFATRRARMALHSHRGFDPGALEVARALGRSLEVPVIYSTVTRLLVDLNRSVGHPELFSEFTSGLAFHERERILARYYRPHRQRVEEAVEAHVERGRTVLHVAVHSFTPQLRGEVRNADVGLLYDPRRELEKRFCLHWKKAFDALPFGLRIRRNYPYQGRDDGLTTHLRRRFSGTTYLGVELEMNQAFVAGRAEDRRMMVRAVIQSLNVALGS